MYSHISVYLGHFAWGKGVDNGQRLLSVCNETLLTYKTLLSGFSSLVICLCTCVHVCSNTPKYLGHCFLSFSLQEDCVSSCIPELIRRWSSRFSPPPFFFLSFFFLNALAQGFYCIFPWHAPLLWSEFSCVLLSGCASQLNGSSYRATGKQNTFFHCLYPLREKEALQFP